MKSSYKLNSNIVLRKIEDEIVILTTDDGFVHQLNETATKILESILFGHDKDFIAKTFFVDCDVVDDCRKEDIRQNIDDCISDLINKGILISEAS